MRSRRLLVVGIVLFLLCQMQFLADGADAASGDLQITEVHPKEEFFVITNSTSGSIDLKGYCITDGEGTLEVIRSLVIAASGTLTIGNGPSGLSLTDTHFSKKGNIQLADSGDELLLYRGNTICDSVCWGKSQGVDGWLGEPVPCSSGYHLLRTGPKDTGTAEDWVQTKYGWTNLSIPDGFEARVHPFSFPESHGEPVLKMISEAEESIDICIYLLSSPKVISVLCQQAEKGTSVRVLVEGAPLGTDITTEISLLKSLTDAGGEVRVINHPDSEASRFLYVHSKYAVIDSSYVIVTSENWTAGNIGEYGNRGWGAIAESEGLADYMGSVFENDFSTDWGDVSEFSYLYPNARPYSSLPASIECECELEWYDALVTPVLSPDDSFVALQELISGADERVYAEQMDLASSLAGRTGDTPISWMNTAASQGADVRFILDISQSDGAAHEQIISEISSSTNVKAVGISGRQEFSLVHNKGVIVDDSVWIGSVNWTVNSFQRNRETALIVTSFETADYFAELFLEDFGVNYYTLEEEGLELQMTRVETSSGPVLLLSVNGPAGTEYEWSLGDGTVRTGAFNRTLFRLPGPGTYTATVRIPGTDYSCSATYVVEGDENGYLGHMNQTYVALAVSLLVIGIGMYLFRQRFSPPERGRMYR